MKKKVAKKKIVKRRPAKKVAKKKIKKTAKRRGAKKAAPKSRKLSPAGRQASARIEKPIGVVTHFYNHIKVAIVKFKKPARVGTSVRFRGATTDFAQILQSLEYDHKPVAIAPKAKQIGVKVGKRVREGDGVFIA